MGIKIENLKIIVDNKEILKDINLEIEDGKIYFLIGPNGSGKTTLCKAILGYPNLKISGKIIVDGKDILKLKPWERARLGIFVSYQYPIEIPEVKFRTFLANAYESIYGSLDGFEERLKIALDILKLDSSFLERGINHRFSGGEKKKSEMLQMLVLKPRYIFLDEPDSGIDFDSLKIISNAILKYKEENPEASFLIITHYGKILEYIKPDLVYLIYDGKIVAKGDYKMVKEVEQKGYEAFIKELKYDR